MPAVGCRGAEAYKGTGIGAVEVAAETVTATPVTKTTAKITAPAYASRARGSSTHASGSRGCVFTGGEATTTLAAWRLGAAKATSERSGSAVLRLRLLLHGPSVGYTIRMRTSRTEVALAMTGLVGVLVVLTGCSTSRQRAPSR
ncbi:hypothetical protein GCM10009869_31220 [Amnibacterium kyonggiense]